MEDTEPAQPRFIPARPPGSQLDTTRHWSPLQLFQLFFSASAVRSIVDNTNSNAQRRKAAGIKAAWTAPLSAPEFFGFLSIIIFAGLVSVHDKDDMWRRDWPYRFEFPRDTMSRGRFEAIMWSLHLSNPREDEENERKRGTAGHDKLFKIKPLSTDILLACKSFYQPNREIAIDERMVKSKARVSFKQYTKAKPTKWGYKLYVLADSNCAYTWNFFIYEGKSAVIRDKGLSYTSVMDLMDFHLLGSGYKLYVDNFYTSPTLFTDLQSKGTMACGTIRTNRKGFPKTTRNNLPKKAQRGDMRWIRDGSLLFVKWMDTREVTMCSTIHKAFSGATAKRKLKEGGQWRQANVPIPDAVADYNANMGGVDLSDALIGYYTVLSKTMKWYKTFFYHFVDIAVVNSFILHKDLAMARKEKTLTQKRYREILMKEMADLWKAEKSRAAPAPTAAALSASAAPPPPPLQCLPEYYSGDATSGRKVCVMCKSEGNKVKTPVYCKKCLVPLCFVSNRRCFTLWHEAKNNV